MFLSCFFSTSIIISIHLSFYLSIIVSIHLFVYLSIYFCWLWEKHFFKKLFELIKKERKSKKNIALFLHSLAFLYIFFIHCNHFLYLFMYPSTNSFYLFIHLFYKVNVGCKKVHRSSISDKSSLYAVTGLGLKTLFVGRKKWRFLQLLGFWTMMFHN